jgi:hypothetical protein
MKFWWYDGNPNANHGIYKSGNFVTPLRPSGDITREIIAARGELPHSGCLIVGEKGKLFAGDDYGARFQVMLDDDKEFVDSEKHEACKAVPVTIARTGERDTDLAMKKEWFAMMKGGPAAYSNFDVAAYLTESILLGCIALRSGVGVKLDWDGPNMRSTNNPEAARFVKPQTRKGWEV